MSSPPSSVPVFNDVPQVVVALSAAIAAVSVAGLILPLDWAYPIYTAAAVSIGFDEVQPLGPLAPYALHVFVHGSWMHLGLNLLALLAFGAGAARGLGDGWRAAAGFLAVFFAAAVAGAATEALFMGERPTRLVGASGGVFGLIAGAVYMYRDHGGRMLSPFSATYLTGLAPWVALNLLTPLGATVFPMLALIAWKAHLGGLAAGVALYPLARAWARGG